MHEKVNKPCTSISHPPKNNGRIVIIGGGLAGLTAAVSAAKNGTNVTLFEASKNLGGRAQTTEIDGYYFNMGPHALYKAGAGLKTLNLLGISINGNPPVIDGALTCYDRQTHLLPTNMPTTLFTGLFNVREKYEFARFMANLNKINSREYDHLTLAETADHLLKSTKVKEYFYALCRLSSYSHAPYSVSGGAMLDQLKISAKGALYLDQGWGSLIEKLTYKAEKLGVNIFTSRRIKSIEKQETGFQINDGKSGTITADAVIVAVSPIQAQNLVGDSVKDLKPYADKAVSVHLACLDIALSKLPNPKNTFALGTDRPHYFSVHSDAAKLAPDDGALIHSAEYLMPGTNTPREISKQRLASLTEIHQENWQQYLVHQNFRPNMLVSNWLPLAKDNGLQARPHHSLSKDGMGLFIAGDWVGDTGLLSDAAFASGYNAGTNAAIYAKERHQ